MLSWLGPYAFVGMTGTPGLPMAQILAEMRPGVNGTTLWRLGVWGRPCMIETVAAMVNYQAALGLWQTYPLATAMNPLPMWIGGVVVSGGKYQVMRVDADVHSVIRFNVPNDPTNYQGVVRARWTLLPIADFV